jgi:hypothetical protein
MRCPSCESTKHVVTETKRASVNGPEDALRRRRMCSDCGHSWVTTERIDRWDPHKREWEGRGPELPPLPPKEQKPRQQKPAAFWPVAMDAAHDYLQGIDGMVCNSFLAWWNDSRRSKHGANAAWTVAAFRLNAERVRRLAYWQQQLLVNAGIEHGWQALNPNYLRDELARPPLPPGSAGFGPKSSGLAGALALIEGGKDA